MPSSSPKTLRSTPRSFKSSRVIAPVLIATLVGAVGAAGISISNNTAGSPIAAVAFLDPTQTLERPALSSERLEKHIESFEYVWNSVKEKHWDPDLNGVDWDQARTDLLPKIQEASSDGQARAVINELLSRLGQSHFGIIPSSSYEKLEEESKALEYDESDDLDSTNETDESDETEEKKDESTPVEDSDEPGWSGINARLVDERFLVTKVYPGSPAEAAGVKTGWIIESIQDRKMSSLIEISKDIDGVMRPETQAGLILHSRLQGNAGKSIRMNFIDGLNETQEVKFTFADAPGVMGGFGELPPMPIEVEATTLDIGDENGIGYFRLSMFMSPGTVLPTYQQFIKDSMESRGIVIDMRGNFGGIILMAPGMINWLIEEKGLMGTMKMRDAVRGAFDIPLMLNPRKNAYEGKVAVLIDELSISNAEILSAGLKDIGRARIFGTQTAGLALPSTVERLPNGDGFQYAFADYTTSGGYSLEAQGTIPDVSLNYTREGLLSGHDEVLDAATDWILSDQPVRIDED